MVDAETSCSSSLSLHRSPFLGTGELGLCAVLPGQRGLAGLLQETGPRGSLDARLLCYPHSQV